MVNKANTSIKPNRLDIFRSASRPYLISILQQILYQQYICSIVQKDIVWYPSTAVKRNLFLPLIFHVNINETERLMSYCVVSDQAMPTIHLQKLV